MSVRISARNGAKRMMGFPVSLKAPTIRRMILARTMRP